MSSKPEVPGALVFGHELQRKVPGQLLFSGQVTHDKWEWFLFRRCTGSRLSREKGSYATTQGGRITHLSVFHARRCFWISHACSKINERAVYKKAKMVWLVANTWLARMGVLVRKGAAIAEPDWEFLVLSWQAVSLMQGDQDLYLMYNDCEQFQPASQSTGRCDLDGQFFYIPFSTPRLHIDFEFPCALAGIDYLLEQIPEIPTAVILRTSA